MVLKNNFASGSLFSYQMKNLSILNGIKTRNGNELAAIGWR